MRTACGMSACNGGELLGRVDGDTARGGTRHEIPRAPRLSPNCEEGHRGAAEFFAAMTRHADAQAAMERALELDPLCLVVNTSQAWVQFLARRYDASAATCRHVLEMDPGFSAAHRLLGESCLAVGEHRDGVEALRRAVQIEGRQPVELSWLAHGLAVAGRPAEAREIVDELGLLERTRYVSACRLALVHAGLGDLDRAFDALDQACAVRAMGLSTLAVDPRFDPPRSDERFQPVLRRLGLI